MLSLNNIEVIYSDVILVLKGVNLKIEAGGCVALLGANGAGKSTTLKAVSGLIRSEDGAVTGGTIEFDGERIDTVPSEDIVGRGLVHIMEGRRVLSHMTVEQNLLAGGHMNTQAQVKEDLERVYEFIPRLASLRTRTAGYLSGGEQQMMVIGRGLMARPRLMMIDEPSLGLAPKLVEDVFRLLHRLREDGISLLIVEQNALAALELADHGYVLDDGRIVLEGSAEALKANEDVREFYLGLSLTGERRSFRDVKHYRRRKRWLG
ncbi:ABC transporter ATP-binding protein [Nitriliruptoraceae bacterium ZYF776]|nr:ABC transporter ATP-binding protein [Profundirhabdus halotolerans]